MPKSSWIKNIRGEFKKELKKYQNLILIILTLYVLYGVLTVPNYLQSGDLLFQSILLIVALIALFKTSELVIDSSVKLSHGTKIGTMTIGFILIAVITSLPELAVSLTAVSEGEIGISIGNLFGSNIADLALIIGIAAMFKKIEVGKKLLRRISTFLFLVSIVLVFFLAVQPASKLIGLILLAIFIGFVWYSFKKKIVTDKTAEQHKDNIHNTIFWFLAGLVGILISSRFTVDSAVSIASQIGIEQSVIGATVIAIGTSLPELAVYISAIKRNEWSLALGNVLGSTVTNMTLVLGFVLAVSELVIDFSIFTTLISFALVINLLVWYLFTRGKIGKDQGILLLFVYLIFIMTILGVQFVIL